jgi:hypothetical protein
MSAPSSWLPAASEDAMIDSLRQHFKSLMLPPAAEEWLLMLWQATQVFDDVADNDPVQRANLDAAIWNTLVAMPKNPFFQQHAGDLLSAISVALLKWQASDAAERTNGASAKSYMWRAGYYDVILLVVQLVHGPAAATAVAHKVMDLYGETLDDYMKEFGHA